MNQPPAALQTSHPASAAGEELDTVAVGRPVQSDGGQTVGRTLGRYVVLEELGRGGMGRVYRAYDPKLRRELALKVLSRDVGTEGRARIVREAQSLARLNHPNVVAVYDVERAGSEQFIAMEFVRGLSLQQWLTDGKRSLPNVLDVFAQAGRGLAAAHSAGLVHRDFKPANVLLGDENDSRVRVSDFGLARFDSAKSGAPSEEAPREAVGAEMESRDELSAPLTEAGAVMGTPAYMAPEQHVNGVVDARTDQYAFCVSLFEALHGRRPFRGRGDELLQSKVRLRPKWDPATPTGLRRAVERGLSPDAIKRFDSMDALLDQLRLPSGRQRASWLAAGAVAVAGTGIFAAGQMRERERIAACEDEGRSIEELWTSAVQAQLRAAMAESGSLLAATTANRIDPWISRYVEGWRTARTGVCLQEDSRPGAVSLSAMQTECLEERKSSLGSRIEVVLTGDPEVVPHAVALFAKLPPPTQCLDEAWLMTRARLPDDSSTRRQVVDVRSALAKARAHALAGRYEEADDIATDMVEAADTIGWDPLRAETRLTAGNIAGSRGEYDRAAAHAENAFLIAGASGHDQVAAEAAIDLAYDLGIKLKRVEEGQRWLKIGEMLLRRLGEDDTLRSASLMSHEAAMILRAGEYDRAIELFERVLSIKESILGPDHPNVITSVYNIGIAYLEHDDFSRAREFLERAKTRRIRVLGENHPNVSDIEQSLGIIAFQAGEYDRAIAHQRRSIDIIEAGLGPDHPSLALTLNSLGNVSFVRGEYDEAREIYQRALEVQENAYGPEHADGAMIIANLGNVAWRQGSFEEAAMRYRSSLEIRESLFGPEHPKVADSLHNFAIVLASTGRMDEAEATHRRALAIHERTAPDSLDTANSLNSLGNIAYLRDDFDQAMTYYQRTLAIRERLNGADHVDVAMTLSNIGNVHRARGDLDQAIETYERSLKLRRAKLPEHHPDLAASLHNLGVTRHDQGRHEEAAKLIESALAIREKGSRPTADLASTRWILAKIVDAIGTDRGRAVQLARKAAEGFETDGKASAEKLEEVRTWLRARGG